MHFASNCWILRSQTRPEYIKVTLMVFKTRLKRTCNPLPTSELTSFSWMISRVGSGLRVSSRYATLRSPRISEYNTFYFPTSTILLGKSEIRNLLLELTSYILPASESTYHDPVINLNITLQKAKIPLRLRFFVGAIYIIKLISRIVVPQARGFMATRLEVLNTPADNFEGVYAAFTYDNRLQTDRKTSRGSTTKLVNRLLALEFQNSSFFLKYT